VNWDFANRDFAIFDVEVLCLLDFAIADFLMACFVWGLFPMAPIYDTRPQQMDGRDPFSRFRDMLCPGHLVFQNLRIVDAPIDLVD
jgi:hypothetical protein